VKNKIDATYQVYQKASLLKVLSNPVRLCIVKELITRGESNVSTVQHCLETSQSTISQHLSRLRDMGIVHGDRRGAEVYYRVVSEDATVVVKTLFNI